MKNKIMRFIMLFILFLLAIYLSSNDDEMGEIISIVFIYSSIFYIINVKTMINCDFSRVKNESYIKLIKTRIMRIWRYFFIYYVILLICYVAYCCLLFKYLDEIIFKYFSISFHSSIIFYLITLYFSFSVILSIFSIQNLNISIFNRICAEYERDMK